MTVSYISLRSCAYFNAPIPFQRPSFDQLWLHSYRPQTTAPLAVAFDTMGKARTINPFPKGNESLFLNSGQLSCCQRLSSEQNKPPHQTMVLSLLSKIYYGSFKVQHDRITPPYLYHMIKVTPSSPWFSHKDISTSKQLQWSFLSLILYTLSSGTLIFNDL